MGKDEPKTFILHESLVYRESAALEMILKGKSKEASERKVTLPEEDPELFGYFIGYLYGQAAAIPPVTHNTQYAILARLYALGERQLANNFQKEVFHVFSENLFNGFTMLSDHEVCELLVIAETELAEREEEDPLRKQILWYASRTNVHDRVKHYDGFKQLLKKFPAIGMAIKSRPILSLPIKPAKPSPRFSPESVTLI